MNANPGESAKMNCYVARANLTTVGDDRATALKRFERFAQQFVDEGLITGFSLDEPGDMEDDISEGVPATWMSELQIEFEGEHEWPTDDLSDDEADAAIKLINADLERIRVRMAEQLEKTWNVEHDYFNYHDELTFEDGAEPAESDPLWGAQTTMRTDASVSAEEARYLFDKVLESWRRDGFLTTYRIDPDGGNLSSDEGKRYSKIDVYFRVSRDLSEEERAAAARELLASCAEQMEVRAAEQDVEFLGWAEIRPLG